VNSIFRNTSFDILAPERAQALESFARRCLEKLNVDGWDVSESTKLSDLDAQHWREICDSPEFYGKNPILDTKGGLDYIALCEKAGIDLFEHWDKVSSTSGDDMMLEMERSGLHGLHFRMNLPDPALRLAAVGALAEHLFYLEEKVLTTTPNLDYCHYPIVMMSCAIDDITDKLDDYQHWISRQDSSIPEYTSARLIELLQFEGAGSHPGSKMLFELALKQLISEKGLYEDELDDGTLERATLLFQIQKALRPLVYNVGYRLKIQGHTNEQVQAAVVPTIDSLLYLAQISPDLTRALKRQILINLFSAFPEALEQLQAKPEELQGVMLDEVLITHPDARHFQQTLAGPLALFSVQETLSTQDKGYQVIEFLTAAGYPLHADIAVRGELYGTPQFESLLLHCQGDCEALKTHYLTRYHDFGMPYDIAQHLTRPDVLAWYDDKSALSIIELALPYALPGKPKHELPLIDDEFNELSGFVADRPWLVKPILDILVRNQCVNTKAFQYFGFSGKDLDLLSSKSSDRIREDILAGDLGL
jgi:hypothetical protein